MKLRFLRALAAITLAALLPRASALTMPPSYFDPGLNFFFTAWMDVPIVKTEAEIAAAITTYSNFPAGMELNNAAGITILTRYYFDRYFVDLFNGMNLKVGTNVLSAYPVGIFTDVFGIAAPGVFGFGGGNFIGSFGIPGSPIFFAQDLRNQDANRFFATPHGGMAYTSNSPDLAHVPDNGSAFAMLAMALVGAGMWRRFIGCEPVAR